MWRIDIYVETDTTTPREQERMTGYVLECVTASGETRTVQAIGRKIGTYHSTILKTLIEALKRINQNCELHIHTQDTFVLDMLDKNLSIWAGNDFRTRKGDLVKNHFQWRTIWDLTNRHLVVTEPGPHSYQIWLQTEMAKTRRT